jgi:hypothetical protein
LALHEKERFPGEMRGVSSIRDVYNTASVLDTQRRTGLHDFTEPTVGKYFVERVGHDGKLSILVSSGDRR